MSEIFVWDLVPTIYTFRGWLQREVHNKQESLDCESIFVS